MKSIEGRVAVVTGASSGIGLAVAKELARGGMSVVLASQNPERLARAEAEVAAIGADVLAVATDVGDEQDVFRLAERTLDRFGAVDVLVNNAGVYVPGFSWEISDEDWKWVMDVNLWGPIYGLRAFMPHLLARDEAHVVNVSSAGGLMTAPCHGPYTSSKHALVGLSKGLRSELAIKQAAVGVTLVCPGGVATSISSQPETTGPGGVPRERPPLAPEIEALWQAVDATVESGIASEDVGAMVRRAILENQFWVLPNAEVYYPVFEHESAEMKAGISS